MASSQKKIDANHLNGQKSHGPNDTSSTRYNATKHGLLTHGVTPLDDAEGYQTLLRDLIKEEAPVGPTEIFLVEAAALDMTRWRRARRLEAEYVNAALKVPLDFTRSALSFFETDSPPPDAVKAVQCLVNIFQRYESAFSARFFKTLHELDRLQRTRRGEQVPAPAALDVTVHAAPSLEAPVAATPAPAAALPGDQV